MITKEEAISQKYNTDYAAIDTSDIHLMNAINQALDVYAEDRSIGFAEWLNKNNDDYFIPKDENKWVQWDDFMFETELPDYKAKRYTTKELYKLYLISIKQ